MITLNRPGILLLSACFLISYAQEDEYVITRIKDHKDAVLSVAFSPDNQYLVSGGEDKMLMIYDLNLHESAAKYTDNYFPPRAIHLSQVNHIFLGAGSDIKMVDLNNKTLAVYKGNATQIWSLGYAPERNKLTAGSYDYTIKVWDVATTEMELELVGHEKSTLPVTFSPDEKYIVSGSLDRTVKVWNAKTGELLKTLERHTDNIYDIDFHPTGKYFASASRDKTIRLWDFKTGEVLVTYVGHDKGILDIEFTPDGRHIVSASIDGTMRVWQAKTGKMIYTFTGHEGMVNCIDINADGTLLASGGEDAQIILWELSKKIFVEFAYYDEFHEKIESAGLYDPRRRGEKKEDYELRMKKAGIKEKEILEDLYSRYIEELKNQSFGNGK